MPNPQTEKSPVDLGKKTEVFTVNKWFYFICFISIKLGILLIGVYITKVILYEQCLLNQNVNSVVVSYFCFLSSACFIALGLPIEKLANTSFAGGK